MIDLDKVVNNCDAREVKQYEFAVAGKMGFDLLCSLKRFNEGAAERFASYFEQTLREPVEVLALSPRELSSSQINDYTAETQSILRYAKGDNHFALAVSNSLGFAIVDRMLGGLSAYTERNRPLTSLERKFLEAALKPLVNAYVDYWPENATSAEPLCNDDHEMCFAGSCGAVECRFHLQAGLLQAEIGFLYVLPKCQTILNAFSTDTISPTGTGSTASQQDMLARIVNEVRLPMNAVLGTTKMPVIEIAGLAVGDVIQLEAAKPGEIHLCTGGRTMFSAKPLAIAGNLAVQIS